MPSLLEKVFSQHREDVEVTAQDVVREKECHSPQAYAPLGLSCVAMIFVSQDQLTKIR